MNILSVQMEPIFGKYSVCVETEDNEVHECMYNTEAEATMVFNEMQSQTDFSYFPEPCE